MIGPDEPVLYDSIVTKKLDYEVELAVVIGKPGRHIPVEQALEHVFGYTVANDITARDRQAVPHPEGGFEYALGPGKNFDTSAPLGPWIVTRDEIARPAEPRAAHLRQRRGPAVATRTAKMIWSVAEIVAFFSHFYTLRPGVVLETGTPGGTAWATDPEIGGKPYERDDVVRGGYLQVGDVVRSRSTASERSPIRSSRRNRVRKGGSTVTLLIPDAPTLFLNARLIDGNRRRSRSRTRPSSSRATGSPKVGKTPDFGESPNGNMRVLDLAGKTLMPGLIEGHFHISFWGVRELPDLDLKLPAERTTVYAVKNAELALRCGYTAVASAGALHRIDVTIRDMVDEGIIPGPRMAASGRDICATSGMLDWNPSFWKLGMDGLAIFADGVEEVRKAVRQNINEGCDVIKLYVTGEGLLRPGVPPEETMYSFEEIAVAVDEAHKRNRQIAAHVRGNDGVKLCVEAGVDVLEHATYADDEASR